MRRLLGSGSLRRPWPVSYGDRNQFADCNASAGPSTDRRSGASHHSGPRAYTRSMSRWTAVAELGQSVWYDNVARPALAGGHLAQLVDSRPRHRRDVEPVDLRQGRARLRPLRRRARARRPRRTATPTVFERCWIEDIQRACDLLRPVWERTGGPRRLHLDRGGGGSRLRGRAGGGRAHELRALVDRPNVMVKIPGHRRGRRGVPPADPRGPEHQHDAAVLARALPPDRRGLRRRAERARRRRRGRQRDRVGRELLRLADRRPGRRSACPRTRRCAAAIAVANAKLAYADVFLPDRTPARRGSGSRPPARTRSARCGPRPAARTPPTRRRSTSTS